MLFLNHKNALLIGISIIRVTVLWLTLGCTETDNSVEFLLHFYNSCPIIRLPLVAEWYIWFLIAFSDRQDNDQLSYRIYDVYYLFNFVSTPIYFLLRSVDENKETKSYLYLIFFSLVEILLPFLELG